MSLAIQFLPPNLIWLNYVILFQTKYIKIQYQEGCVRRRIQKDLEKRRRSERKRMNREMVVFTKRRGYSDDEVDNASVRDLETENEGNNDDI